MELTLGLDVGTSSVKCVAADQEGSVAATGSAALELLTSRGGWVEQDGSAMWRAAGEACRQVMAKLDGKHRLAGMSISSQGGTTIPVDKVGEPVRLGFSWMDERAEVQAAEVVKRFGAEKVYRTTGWRLSNGLPLNHIAWFKQNEPELFAKTARFCFVNDFIAQRLCGEYWMDPSDAGITQLYSLANNRWDEELIEQAGVKIEQLSPIRESGTWLGGLSARAAAELGIPAGLPIFNGAHDQYCSALGSGAVKPGSGLLSGGTAWVVMAVFANPDQAFEAGMEVSRHALPNLFGGIRSMGGVGASMEWLMNLLWQGLSDRDLRAEAIHRAVADSPAGAGGLRFVPLTGGHLDASQANQGVLEGLELGHTRGDITRALMEGIAFELRWMLENAQAGSWVDSLTMIGGAARSRVWPQMIADISGLPIRAAKEADGAALGAARLAALGAGLINEESVSATVEKQAVIFKPNPDLAKFYGDLFAKYQAPRESRRAGKLEIG